jgi:hypothetical protein
LIARRQGTRRGQGGTGGGTHEVVLVIADVSTDIRALAPWGPFDVSRVPSARYHPHPTTPTHEELLLNLSEPLAMLRFLRELPAYARARMTPDEARSIIRTRLDRREEHFLEVLEQSVFAHPESPYAQLLAHARCAPDDLRKLIRADGVDAALTTLRQANVYIAFEEFKGTRPIVRDGKIIHPGPDAFLNPHSRAYYRAETGGSTGRGRHVQMDVPHLLARVPHRLLCDEFHGMLGVPSALWFEILPGNGPQSILQRVPYGAIPQRWFTPVVNPPLKYRFANRAIVEVARRIARIPFPRPEHVPLDRADIIARWAAETIRAHGGVAIFTHPSKAVRVAIAARELGLDLTGAVFSGGGEPVTQAKVDEIARAGGRFVSGYIAMETGIIGMQCPHATDPNEQHFFRDHLAVIQHPRAVEGFDVEVDTFHFTTLLPSSPRLLINVELDDFGVIDRRRCGCAFEELGFPEHISGIRSFRKLTGEGMTLIGTEVDHVIESVLPARCGGTALDYQLIEEEADNGLTRLVLTVSPRVPSGDDVVREVMLEALARGSTAAAISGTIWSQGDSLRIRRTEPEWTARGKRPVFRAVRR